MLVNCVSGLWRNWNNSASMWLTIWSNSGAGDCEAVSMQMVNILCDWHSDYHNQRHCCFLSVWLYCIDCIATCSALYSLALIRLFTAKNIYYIFHKVQCQQNLHSLANIFCKFYANWPIIIWIIAKNKRRCFFMKHPVVRSAIGIVMSSVCLWCCALWLNNTSYR